MVKTKALQNQSKYFTHKLIRYYNDDPWSHNVLKPRAHFRKFWPIVAVKFKSFPKLRTPVQRLLHHKLLTSLKYKSRRLKVLKTSSKRGGLSYISTSVLKHPIKLKRRLTFKASRSQALKRFSMFYKCISSKKLNKLAKITKQRAGLAFFTHDFGNRLLPVLIHSNLISTVDFAKHLIKHGHVLVNGLVVRSCLFVLNADDKISFNPLIVPQLKRLFAMHLINHVSPVMYSPSNILVNYRYFFFIMSSDFIEPSLLTGRSLNCRSLQSVSICLYNNFY
jgi:ribosomal protein S4